MQSLQWNWLHQKTVLVWKLLGSLDIIFVIFFCVSTVLPVLCNMQFRFLLHVDVLLQTTIPKFIFFCYNGTSNYSLMYHIIPRVIKSLQQLVESQYMCGFFSFHHAILFYKKSSYLLALENKECKYNIYIIK